MKILAISYNDDSSIMQHHLKSAIAEIGLINVEVIISKEIPTDSNTANVYAMSRDLASKCRLPNILIVDDVLNYKDIKEKIERLFTIYGVL